MRVTLFALAAGFALSMSGALADPANTSAAAAATAPEPMAQSAVPQATQTESQGAGSAQPVAAADDQKLICHHPVHEGTILPQQVCLTKHAWELIRLREQKNVSDWQLHGYLAGIKP
jgi:hypothetical protein